MKITTDTSLRDFEFWSGAKEISSRLTVEEMDQIEFMLEELYPEGMSETQLNDLFWFDSDLNQFNRMTDFNTEDYLNYFIEFYVESRLGENAYIDENFILYEDISYVKSYK